MVMNVCCVQTFIVDHLTLIRNMCIRFFIHFTQRRSDGIYISIASKQNGHSKKKEKNDSHERDFY